MIDKEAVLVTVGRVGGKASLNDVVLWELHTTQAPDSESPRQILVHTDIEQKATRRDDGFDVTVDYTVRGVLVDEERNNSSDAEAAPEVMAIAASWRLIYGLPDGVELSDDDLIAYSDITARFTVHPYMRELVQQMTVRMGFPPLLMDNLKFPLDDLLAGDAAVANGGT